MITECIAVYQADLDMVQVSAVIQEDDGSTLHDGILEASIKLLFNDNEIIVKSIEAIEYNVEEKAFYVFFIHPPVKRNMFVQMDVLLRDDRKATVKSAVSFDMDLPYGEIASNPMLSGRVILDYTNKDRNPM